MMLMFISSTFLSICESPNGKILLVIFCAIGQYIWDDARILCYVIIHEQTLYICL